MNDSNVNLTRSDVEIYTGSNAHECARTKASYPFDIDWCLFHLDALDIMPLLIGI